MGSKRQISSLIVSYTYYVTSMIIRLPKKIICNRLNA